MEEQIAGFDLTLAYLWISSDEGPLYGDPISLALWRWFDDELRRWFAHRN